MQPSAASHRRHIAPNRRIPEHLADSFDVVDDCVHIAGRTRCEVSQQSCRDAFHKRRGRCVHPVVAAATTKRAYPPHRPGIKDPRAARHRVVRRVRVALSATARHP